MASSEPGKNWKAVFFTVWSGQAFSLFGSALVQFALVWWLTQSTGSATVLAMATLMAVLPGVLLGPFSGALVDRWNRRVVMIVADGAIALVSLWLALMYAAGAVQVWHVYVIMVARAVGGSFHQPAMQASTSLMVPKEQLSRVAGLNQGLNAAVSIVAPVAGALVLAVLPMPAILTIDVVTAALAITALLFVRIPQPQRAAAGAGAPNLLREVHEGLRYVWTWPGLLAILCMAAVLNFLLNPAFALMPILVTKHFGGQALQLSWLESAFGVGMLAGSIALGVWGGFRRRIVTSMTGIAGMGLGCLLLGIAPGAALWLALLGAGVTGIMSPIANGPLMAVMQATVAPEMQGRVFNLVGAVCTAMVPIGMLVAGPVADAFGTQVWFLVGGVACALMAVLGLMVPAIADLENQMGARVPAPEPAVAEAG